VNRSREESVAGKYKASRVWSIQHTEVGLDFNEPTSLDRQFLTTTPAST
jgi:hypothetical protein